jgi:lysozyme
MSTISDVIDVLNGIPRDNPKEIGTAGIELIKSFEGLRLEAYKCPANVWTIGYGHTSGVFEGMEIFESTAEVMLKEDLKNVQRNIMRAVKVPLSQYQFDALCSFAFNVGIGAFLNSTMLAMINVNELEAAADEFPKWKYAGGSISNGLIRRREAERGLFLSPK